MTNFKTRIIQRLTTIRSFYNTIYSFFLSAYLGKTIIALNHIDELILNWIFYFFVYNPQGEGIKEFHRVVSSRTMGTKLNWLKNIYLGNMKFTTENVTLKQSLSISILIGNKTLKEIIDLLSELIVDIRNPLAHSHYLLGYGNESQWKLVYERSYFNRKTDEIERLKYTTHEAREYLQKVKATQIELQKLFVSLLDSQKEL